LKNNDRIRICDFIAAFLEQQAVDDEDDGEESEGPSTVEAMLNHTSHMLLETQPAEKLRLLVEISGNLAKTLELKTLLPKIADSIFQLFKQADRCFVIQQGEGEKLIPHLVKTRRAADETTARLSKGIVRRCLESAQAFLSDDASRDDRIQLSQSVVDFRIRSVMCAPLARADGKTFGVIQLDTQDRSKKFTQEDLKLLCGVANQASIAMENARLLDDAVRQERLQRDLQLAQDVQMSFLPKAAPQVQGYESAGHSRAAREVGGDYFGYIPLPGGKMAVAVGDVAGKGVSASLLMAKLSSDIRFAMLTDPEPGRATFVLNNLLYEFTSPMDRFITLCAVVIDPSTHEATIVSGGHSAPYLYKSASAELSLSQPKTFGGPPLGMVEDVEFETAKITLKPGESLILFTDGVDESMNT